MTFDPGRHEYREGEEIISSVTQILVAAGVIDDRWYTEESRERGSAVHQLCERYALGERTSSTGYNLESYEYINAFAAWMRDKQVSTIKTEAVIYGEVLGRRYAGKYDLLADIGGRRILVDFKTGGKAKWHHIQIAAYALQVNPDGAALLYLKPDGKYKYDYLTGLELLEGIRKFKEYI